MMSRALLLLAWLCCATIALPDARADTAGQLRLVRGHSTVVKSKARVASVAVGDPSIARATALNNTSILINGVRPGSTSLTLILQDGNVVPHRVIVTHDLAQLARHLSALDARIRVESDANGNAVILSGVVASKTVVERAVEAAQRFFGQSEVTIRTNPRESRERAAGAAAQPPATRAAESGSSVPVVDGPVAGSAGERSYIEEEITSGNTRVINLLVTEDTFVAAAKRLEGVLQRVDKAIKVEEVNSVFVLRGKVASPAALSRALAVADRFVRSDGNPEFAVISDRGGVLAGNLEPTEEFGPVVDVLQVPRALLGGGSVGTTGIGSRSVGGGGNGLGFGTAGLFVPTEVSPAKGNLAQNVSRADVVMVAGGRVMSLLEVSEQPRVEIKMSIVAVDRNRTEELGINWRIDGSNVTVTTTGDRIFTPPNNPVTSLPGVTQGGLNAVGKMVSGNTTVQVFLQALEQTGAAQSVSEPLLSAVSGEATSFLIGGNIPIPVETLSPGTPTSNAVLATNVAFIEFGLRIVVRPTVLEDGRISIVLDQILTEPDDSRAVRVRGVDVPGFKQRSVRTLTESQDGETWAVAGLVSDTDSKNVTAVPYIARIPILGALFRSKTEDKARSELIVTVTARRVPQAAAPAASALPGASPDAKPQSSFGVTVDEYIGAGRTRGRR
jgi:Flp pilus assembly secretin CpaC